jgi:hypothetical protein
VQRNQEKSKFLENKKIRISLCTFDVLTREKSHQGEENQQPTLEKFLFYITSTDMQMTCHSLPSIELFQIFLKKVETILN